MKKIIKTVKMGINGEGIGYIDKIPVFIKGALPNETVEVDVVKGKEKYIKTEVIKVLEKNVHRVIPPCSYQKDCSCELMTLDYKSQLEYKKELLEEALYKYAGIQRSKIEDFIENDNVLNYRNQCKLPIKEDKYKLVSGLYMPETNRLIKINKCIVHEEIIEKVRKDVMYILNKHKVKAFDRKSKKGIRFLVIRSISHKTQVTLVGGNDVYSEKLIEDICNIDSVVSLYQNINDDYRSIEIFKNNEKLLGGAKYLSFKMFGLKIKLLPQSFFQLNTSQTEKLYNLVDSLIEPANTIVEAYCGIGIMSMMVSNKAKKIIGIESVKSSIINARQTAKINDLDDKCEFVLGDAAKELKKLNKKDYLIVDPPRSGLSDEMLDTIIDKKIRNIIYVSCNPATLGKNLSVLNRFYKIKRIIPIDMFSNTPHVETVVLLQRADT